MRSCFAVIAVALLVTPAQAQKTFHYDAANIDTAAHWAARATLANAVMFSGLGERLDISLNTLDMILKHAGYIARPPMPDMAMVGAVYASGAPLFAGPPSFADPATLVWDGTSFDHTLEPAVQAWTLAKIASPGFHLNYHDRRDDRRIALLMVPQAEAQAATLETRLRNPDGLFAARGPSGLFATPRPHDQAAALWAISNLILAATSPDDDYWHAAWRDLTDADDWRALADAAFAAVEALPPRTPGEHAIAVVALGHYAIAIKRTDRRERALALARRYAEFLKESGDSPLADTGLTIYGLVEAGRLLEEPVFAKAATIMFRDRLRPLWDGALGAFRPEGAASAVYTPWTLGALATGLNAMRWYGPAEAAAEADRLYPRLLETVLVEAGMLVSSPLPLVPKEYLDQATPEHFAHPALPLPGEAGLAPVFAAEVRHADGEWSVSDPTFRAAEAMFLANMLVKPHDGQADAFLPGEWLAALQR